ncbi:MAG: SMP-30/gluconolactonase/LRE family protein [Acidobacteriia bacterium]|nr:SMP-30/gluconolactonase/LRE family protein [Terriglobia bacterium]
MLPRRKFVGAAATAAASVALKPWSWARASEDAAIARYPDANVQSVDPRFDRYKQGTAAIERLYTGCRWAEGPVWFGDGQYLLWSDIPNNRILRWTEETGKVSAFRQPSNCTNGNTRDKQGRLISCEQDSRRVTRTELDGTITVLIDRFQGKHLNAPNDVIVHSSGSIWFTDPGYGIMSNYEGHVAEFELPTNVYRLDPATGEATVVTAELIKPNGLAFSPDEKKLYIVDTGPPAGKPHPIYVYDVVDGKRLANGRLFYDMGVGSSDGIRCDVDGNVWSAAGWGGPGYDGVQVIAPDGKLIGKILLPETCANLCFGGVKRNRLFMAASQSLYSLYVNTQGAQTP